MGNEQANAVTRFWFALDPASWFAGGEQLDAELRSRFEGDVACALRGELEGWAESSRGRLALVLLLDQVTRNIYRGGPQAFSGDARALDHASRATSSGEDQQLEPRERYFLYLPFEHAEDQRAQERAVSLYQGLEEGAAGSDAFLSNGVSYAERHHRVIARFGRFPSRNAALGRTSTAAEREFLRANPMGF